MKNIQKNSRKERKMWGIDKIMWRWYEKCEECIKKCKNCIKIVKKVGKNMKWVQKMGEIYWKCEECKENMRMYNMFFLQCNVGVIFLFN